MIKSSSHRMAGIALALCSLCAATLLTTAAPALAETCPTEEFRTGAGANLSDCRAYELVTPPFKEAVSPQLEYGGAFYPLGLFGIAPDGDHVDVFSTGNLGDAQAGYAANSYELTRTASGWMEKSIDLPGSQFPASEALATTPAMGATIYQARSTDQSINAKDFWLREADGALRDIGPFEPPEDTQGLPGLQNLGGAAGYFRGASKDLSHVLFTSPVYEGLMEYNTFQGGPPVPVGLEPDGTRCPATGLRLPEDVVLEAHRTLSADGSIVYFECSTNFLARVEEARTVALSEPSAADCSACHTGTGAEIEFSGTAAGGSEFFFTSTGAPLLGSDKSTNIYEYDFDAPQASAGDADGRIVDISAGDWGPGGAQVERVEQFSGDHGEAHPLPTISEDGSHVYFLARGVLQGARNSRGESPIEGNPNLYVYERDAQFPEGRLSFITTAEPGTIENSVDESQSVKATTTPDGRFLIFTSTADLTPDDTSTTLQIFEYDAQTGELVRCSIGQDGFNDDGNTDTFNAELPNADYPELGAEGLRGISDNGEYVVFQSADGLTPGALDGYVGEYDSKTILGSGAIEKHQFYANNVYEYHDGNVYLISDGQDTSSGGFGVEKIESSVKVRGISSSGDDIFFETADKLVPQDQDDQRDLYDARIDGGFPAPVSLLPTCTGDACQGELSSSPTLLSPGSEFQAGGNPPLQESMLAPKAKAKAKAKRCNRGYAKKRGKCVKVKAKKAGNDRRVKS